MKFFVCGSFDNNLDVMRFKPTLVSDTNLAGVNDKNAEKKKRNPKNLERESNKEAKKSSTLLQGCIEKLKNKKSNKHQQMKGMTKTFSESLEKLNNRQETLVAKVKERLKGGRFRFINEQLYTMSSRKAAKLFEADPDAFYAYHEGYRHQIARWPLNPLKRITKMIKRLPKSLEIGDFGCGEGQLAEAVPNKVYSLDLVSCRNDIITCDMAQTPLKTHSLDVAVYCLSLMGTNLNECFLEANRVLKVNGFLYIAEIQSRFDNVTQFVRHLLAYGFQLIKQDFKKMRNVGIVAKVPQITLKPCLYKKLGSLESYCFLPSVCTSCFKASTKTLINVEDLTETMPSY
uniref:Ribosomal RNA-processing protein 8 n=1 Tax=Glossina brevipalpis TaxID=37001 RepID=A0A1A9W3L0_9MUSC